ncbi:MAG: ATP-binding cassette domain-containing protein [Ignavibacterium sp.]
MLRADISKISILNSNEENILLKNISFNLDPNVIYTILGENGSGKSTLIKSLTLLPDRRFFRIDGKIYWNGKNLFEASEEELIMLRKNQIRYVFQDCINSFDPLKRISYYFDWMVEDKQQLNELLEYFNLPEQTELGKLYPYELSGGMAQRIAIVLAAIVKPKLLILDEPTSAADTAVINLLIHFLRDYVSDGNNSVLIVTQDLLFAEKVSDMIAEIKNHTLTEFQVNQSVGLK